MSSDEPLLKKVKVEHEPDGQFGCLFCFESCREYKENRTDNLNQHIKSQHTSK